MRSLFNPLRCDVFNFENREYIHHQLIPNPLFRVVSTAVSNSCILFKAHMVYSEFSTLNLIEAQHIRERNHVILIVKRNITFVTAKFVAYSFIFGTPYLSRQFHHAIVRHVHRQQIIERPRRNDIPTQAEQEVVIINADVTMEPLEVEAESIINRDSNEAHISSLENSNADDSD